MCEKHDGSSLYQYIDIRQPQNGQLSNEQSNTSIYLTITDIFGDEQGSPILD